MTSPVRLVAGGILPMVSHLAVVIFTFLLFKGGYSNKKLRMYYDFLPDLRCLIHNCYSFHFNFFVYLLSSIHLSCKVLLS